MKLLKLEKYGISREVAFDHKGNAIVRYIKGRIYCPACMTHHADIVREVKVPASYLWRQDRNF
ncbi:MAG: hypothetical protein JRI72_00220 [Deltaproteobacteria bacterium]|nr:hypothetical protein [Deltaproteobacteria bacterium]